MKFLVLNLFITLFLVTLISCTKEKVKEEPLNIKTFGEFKYIEAETDDKNLLAEYNDIKINKDEVIKKSKVIQELNQQESDLHSVLVYRTALNHLDKLEADKTELKESYELVIYSQEPKEGFVPYANRLKLTLDERIQVKFEEVSEELTNGRVIGSFDNNSYSLESLEKNHIRYIEIRTQKFDESLRLVKGILTRRLLFSDAKAKGLSVQDLVKQHIIKGDINPTAEEIVQFMRSKNISDNEMTEKMTESFKNILIEQKKNKVIEKYISTNLAGGTVKIYNKAPEAQFDIKADWSPSYGSDQAANTEARMFSESSMCIFSQDKSKFWDYHNKLVDYEGKVAESNLYEFASEVGVDEAEFKSCLLERKTKEIVDYHLKYADYLGLNSQPTLIIKGKIYPGVVNTEKLVQVFNNDLEVAIEEPSLVARIISYFKNLFS